MPDKILRLFLIACLILTLVIRPSAAQEPESASSLKTLKFGFYSGFQPTFKNSLYRVWLRDALAEVGYRAEMHWLPGRRILKQVSMGDLDGDLLRSQEVVEAHFPELIQVPILFGRACYAGYRLKPLSGAGFKPNQIGVFEGVLQVHKLARAQWQNSQLVVVNDPKSAFKMLTAERLDMILPPPQTIQALQKFHSIKLARITPHHIQFDIFMYLNPRHEKLAPKLANALARHKPDMSMDCPEP